MNLEIEHCTRLNSLIHRWDARWKIVAFVCIAGASAAVNTVYGASFAFLTSLVALLLSALPVRVLITRLGILHLFLIPCFIVLPFTTAGEPLFPGYAATREGTELAFLLYFRACAIVIFTIVLIYTTPMNRLLQALEALYCPRVLVQITMLAFRYIHTLWTEFLRIRCALAVRAFENRASFRVYQTWANVIGMTLVRSLERTERVHRAMKCRGYDGRLQRLHSFQAMPFDYLITLIWVLFACMILYTDMMYGALL